MGAPGHPALFRIHEKRLYLFYTAESLDAYVAKQNRYTTLQAEALHASGETASAARIALSPLARFVRFYVMKLGFLDGVAGFAHIAIGAFASFLKYAKLRELEWGAMETLPNDGIRAGEPRAAAG